MLRAAAIALVVAIAVAHPGIAGGAARAPHPRTIVSLEFDHAFTDQLPAVETANSDGMKVTLFAMSGRLGMTGYMTAAQLLGLEAQGNEIGGHTINHPDLAKLSPAAQRYEICDDRVALEADGFDVTDFAYPYGYFNASTPGIVRACGYQSARIAGGLGAGGGCPNPCPPAETIPPRNPFQTRTVNSVMKTTSLATIENYVTAAERSGGGWVQIVFHYVCDGCDPYSVTASTLDRFIAWLAARARIGTTVETVRQVINTPFVPAAVSVRVGTRRAIRLRPGELCPATPVTARCTTVSRAPVAVRPRLGSTLIVTSASPAERVMLGSRRMRRLDAAGRRWKLTIRRRSGPLTVTYPLGTATYRL